MTIYENLKNDKQYKASTGLSRSEFDLLFFFEKLYFSKIGNPYLKDKQPVLTDTREALFFVLHYLKAYPTLVNTGLYFGFSEKTASQYLDRLKPILKAAFGQAGVNVMRAFADEKAFEKLFEGIEELIKIMPTLQVVNEIAQRDPGAHENRRAPENLRVAMNDSSCDRHLLSLEDRS